MGGLTRILLDKFAPDIAAVIEHYYGQRKRLFFWGAGQLGTLFLRRFDPEHRYFAGVIDRNPAKQGQVMMSGQRIFSPEDARADVIFVSGLPIEADVYAFYAARGKRRQVIELQDIFYGKRLEDIFAESETPYRTMRHSRIGGVTVLYNPPEDFIENVRSYADDLDYLLLYDNSPESHQTMVKAAFGNQVEYVWNKGCNCGLPRAFNDAATMMNERVAGEDWLITFDQDSRAGEGMLKGMRAFLDSQCCTKDIALVAPWVVDYHVAGIDPTAIRMPRVSYLMAPMQSGAMHRLSDLQRLRYDENLFIDEVDFDYGVMCHVQNSRVVRLNHCLLLHQVEDAYKTIADDWRKYQKGKYSLQRWYYRYRNALYCTQKYAGSIIYQQYFADHVSSLEKQASLEDNHAEIQQVFRRAREDFEAGRMGQQDYWLRAGHAMGEVRE